MQENVISQHKSGSAEAWIGGPEDERGGASLRFDAMLDETSSLDLRWLRRFQLRTLEILFHQEKFERLVHLALRFNAVTKCVCRFSLFPFFAGRLRFALSLPATATRSRTSPSWCKRSGESSRGSKRTMGRLLRNRTTFWR